MIKKTIFIICVSLFPWAVKNISAQKDSTFKYTGSVQTWTVPACTFLITIDAYGAQGGTGLYGKGGLGAQITGTFTVTPGEVLDILVGQEGVGGPIVQNYYYCGSGGGGTYVWNSSNSSLPMLVAGGGGGSAYQSTSGGGSATTVPTASTGAGCGAGGAGGNGGAGGAGINNGNNATGGGGSGWLSNGQNGNSSPFGGGGYDPANGGVGGAPGSPGGQGGYGGGGGCAGNDGGGGGGGGYNGGGGGNKWDGNAWGGGGGGGSYNGGTNQTNITGANVGNGLVTIIGGLGPFKLVTSVQTNPVCGICNGVLAVAANGGASPYTYSWTPSGQTTTIATGLCAGTYTISVDDSCGDVSTSSVVLTALPLPVSTSVIANPVCSGNCIGSAIAMVGMGSSPYTYSWYPSGGTTATATGLCAGTYTITVTDINGCTGSATAIITQPMAITATDTVTEVPCYGGTGGATIKPVGGASPFTYSWSPGGQTTATVTGLITGSYSINISDINGCTGSTSISVTQPALLTATMGVPSNILCYGESANVGITAGGGTSPYTYFWNPSGQTTATATGLGAGSYTITINDLNGCAAIASIIITQPPLFTAMMGTPNNVPCNGGVGNATVTAGGGVSPYIYSWSPSGGSNAMGTGLSAGSYDVTITDRNGCTATAGVIITQPALLTATISATNDVPCNGGVGNATVTAGGGTLPYTYSWNPTNQTTATATGLIAGTYTIKVTDNHGCTATATISITQPALLTATISATNNVPCNGGIGNATVTAGGGTSPYTYLWNPTSQTNATATGLAAGVYTIKVTDNHGCTATNTVTITQPALLTATMGTPNRILCNGGTGNVTVGVSGGTNPYTYLWTPSAETNALATGLYVGTYTVNITDAHHCTASATVIMTQPAILTATVTSTTGISCTNGNNGTATAKGGGGIAPYTYLWTPSAETNATATNLYAGSYTVTITDANGCTATATTALSQPTPVTATISEPKIICKDSMGILIANPSGGTPNYTYAWSSGGTLGTATVTPTFTNDYSVTVTDANGCTGTANIILQYGPSFAVAISGKRSVCVGDSTTICANAIGAIDGVTYLWEPENSTNECISASPSSVSVYTVTVVDGCGSTTTANTTVYTEPTPTVNMNVNFSSGCVPFCVQFLNASNVSKGKIEQYVWNFGDGDSSYTKQPVYCYKTSGEYDVSLTVVSDSGCSATLKRVDMVTIYGPPKAAFTYSPQPASIETPRVQFIDKSTDAYGIAYQWWAFGDESDSTSNAVNPVHTYHDTGTYCATLIVMNNGGCMDTVTNCLVIEPAFKLYIPSAFTPNGDGRNEVFQAVGQYVKSFEMYVFDRWGMELFHSTSINQGWDGTYKGGICQQDVYVYKITVIDSEDNEHSYVGNVTLLK